MAQEREQFTTLKPDEARARETELRRELFELRMKLVGDAGALKRYRAARKDLARLMTARSALANAQGATR